MRAAVLGILKRHQSLGIHPIQPDIFVHPERDPGCRLKGVKYLINFYNQYRYCILMFDFEGCGEHVATLKNLEMQLECELSQSAWDNRGKVIIIDPELENWVWSNSPHVDRELGWSRSLQGLRDWLLQNELLRSGQMKPDRPKEALERALREVNKPRSSAMYLSLAGKVSLKRCRDEAFLRFVKTLRCWFGSDNKTNAAVT